MNNLYFCTNNREIKNQVEGLNQTVETLSVIFQEIAVLREEIQTTLVKAKDNRDAFQSLSEQLLDIRSQPQPYQQHRQSSVISDSSEQDDESSDESLSVSSNISTHDIVKNVDVPVTKPVKIVAGEMREDFSDAPRGNAVLIRE